MFTFSYIRDIKKRVCAFRIWMLLLTPSLPFYSAHLKEKKINIPILIFFPCLVIYLSSFLGRCI